jgi:hypothetical protein
VTGHCGQEAFFAGHCLLSVDQPFILSPVSLLDILGHEDIVGKITDLSANCFRSEREYLSGSRIKN